MFVRQQTAILAAAGFGGVIAVLVWRMRRLSLRAQFLVLLSFGVAIGFILMTVVQVPNFPGWLATLMVLAVFVAAPFATRTFLRSLKQEEQNQELDQNSR